MRDLLIWALVLGGWTIPYALYEWLKGEHGPGQTGHPKARGGRRYS